MKEEKQFLFNLISGFKKDKEGWVPGYYPGRRSEESQEALILLMDHLDKNPDDLGKRSEDHHHHRATPLLHAAFMCEWEMVRMLLKRGANPLAKNSDGYGLIDMALHAPYSGAPVATWAEISSVFSTDGWEGLLKMTKDGDAVSILARVPDLSGAIQDRNFGLSFKMKNRVLLFRQYHDQWYNTNMNSFETPEHWEFTNEGRLSELMKDISLKEQFAFFYETSSLDDHVAATAHHSLMLDHWGECHSLPASLDAKTFLTFTPEIWETIHLLINDGVSTLEKSYPKFVKLLMDKESSWGEFNELFFPKGVPLEKSEHNGGFFHPHKYFEKEYCATELACVVGILLWGLGRYHYPYCNSLSLTARELLRMKKDEKLLEGVCRLITRYKMGEDPDASIKAYNSIFESLEWAKIHLWDIEHIPS